MNINGRTLCDGCDTDLGNGAVTQALIVSDMVDGLVVTLHFCRDRDDAEGNGVKGCARQVLRPSAIKAYRERNPDAPTTAAPLPPPPPPAVADPADDEDAPDA